MYVTTRDAKGNVAHPCFCSCRSKEDHERKIRAKLGIKEEVKTMDSAKKSVEKILEIAKKHGYACVVGFRKAGHDSNYNPASPQKCDTYSGATGTQKEVDAIMYSSIHPMWDHYKDGVKDGE